ncbi:dethiobiotin synthase [Candidatus Sumerlaeota bacterium]|nr:dethiobiotin synthase [Candidatus Sumerlaeota bacterium]
MPSLLITATDTGVGKTIIAAALARAWRGAGLDVGVMKPFASGCTRDPEGHLVARDAEILRAAARSGDPEDLIAPVLFEAPLAPSAAARLEGHDVGSNPAARPLAELRARHEWLIVEGIGGALVPLTDHILFADWAAAAGLPVLVVARTDLGTLSHTLLTLEALAGRGVKTVGVVLNRCHGGDPDLAERTNPETLARATDVPIWGPVPFHGGLGDDAPVEEVVSNLPALDFEGAIRERLRDLESA